MQLAGSSVSELWLPAPSKHCASASLLQETALGYCQKSTEDDAMFILRKKAWLLLLALLSETSFPSDSVNQGHTFAWHPGRQWGHQKGTVATVAMCTWVT